MVASKQNRIVRCFRPLLLAGAGLALLVILASCGQNFSGASPSSTGANATPTEPSPTPSTASFPTGKVMLRVVSVTPYAISITVANKSNQTILFPDHLSECSVILLQLVPQGTSSQQWQVIAPCRKGIQTQLHTLTPGKDMIVALTAPSGQWAAGLYRAMLAYSLSGSNAAPRTVFSSSFPIGSSNPCQRTDIACQASPGP